MHRGLVIIGLMGCGPVNTPPSIDAAEATCTKETGDWLFQAEVSDDDGASDVSRVSVAVFAPDSDVISEGLFLEQVSDGMWEATLLAADTALVCGDAYDVEFTAEDTVMNEDLFTLSL